MRTWATAGLSIAGLLALMAAWLLPPTRSHPVTPSMLASADRKAGLPVPEIAAGSSDGRTISPGELAADRPTVLVFLQAGCPCSMAAEPYFHRLHAAYGSRVAFLGVIDGDASAARDWAGRHGSPYPVLADPDTRIIRASGAERSVYVALVARGGTIDRLWPGYSSSMLLELGRRLATLGGLPERAIDTEGAPGELASGCPF